MPKQHNWQKIYQEYSPKLLGICRRYIHDIYAAEDIIQESFITAIQNNHQLREEKMLFAWLKKIVVNNALQHRRKASKEVFIITEPLEIPDTFSEMSHYSASEEKKHILAYDFTREELLSSIDSLPSHHRSVFNLYYIENYSHAEISSLLEISVNTSKSHLLRAKKSIQNYLINTVRNQNIPKSRKKTTQILILFGLGGLLWAQAFKSKFSDFTISPSKVFDIPENPEFKALALGTDQNLKKKLTISATLLVIILSSIFLLKPAKSFPPKHTYTAHPASKTNKEKTIAQAAALKTATSQPVVFAKNSGYSDSKEGSLKENLPSKEDVTALQQRSKKTIIKDSPDIPKKVIVVKKIIQKDTIFIER
ncbi:RNA polymerase sigma factor (sigma-70 family) [Chryseobacterium defluvii]|uniref:RNA polymerase sigma factor n=1 Tax=Chryseobacterium defluvii TaxID=160396 RepID=A0A840K9V8_9FLAO|nr:RNA polymerase sigma factor [Chryseobacterium defluvii]MBB4806006.1 RNA polymerase sigma factor (sigma-70 family) [Chryseobacterium defluvii]